MLCNITINNKLINIMVIKVFDSGVYVRVDNEVVDLSLCYFKLNNKPVTIGSIIDYFNKNMSQLDDLVVVNGKDITMMVYRKPEFWDLKLLDMLVIKKYNGEVLDYCSSDGLCRTFILRNGRIEPIVTWFMAHSFEKFIVRCYVDNYSVEITDLDAFNILKAKYSVAKG